MEAKHKIRTRWHPGHSDFQHYLSQLEGRKQKGILQKTLLLAQERSFLLTLQKKYPGEIIIVVLHIVFFLCLSPYYGA